MQAPTNSGNRRLGGRPALRLVSGGLLLGLATMAVAVLPASESGAVPTTGQTFYVNSATDTGNDTGCTSPTNTTCGIDDAITAFNADTTVDHADTIVFTSTIATFTVGHPTQIANTTSGVTLAIDGNGPTTTAVSGGNTNQVFNIGGGTTVTMSGLTIEDGDATGSVATGGGIDNSGTLGLTDSVVNDNAASGTAVSLGGGIFNAGALTVSDSTISNNSTAEGGGIYSNGTATINDSTLSDNHATYSDGGGIVNSAGTLIISNSTISGNTANGPDGDGGGISNFVATMTISNSTISGNTSLTGQGGGIANEGEIIFGPATMTVGATIIANSGSGGNCVNGGPTAVTDLGYNLEDDAGASCGFSTADHDIVGENPDLGPLQNNDGPTDTLALLAGSPAIDLVDSATLCAPPDQRGITRPTPVCDSGAYETSTLFTSSTPGFTSPIADAVPSTVCVVTIAASGGQGGDATNGTLGGDAASVTATVPVTPGAALDVEVAAAGANQTDGGAGGVGGGGGGQANYSGGGGGASAVSSSGTPLVVAGGGGGASDGGGVFGDSPGGAAGTLGNAGATASASDGSGGSGGSPSGDGGAGGIDGGAGGGGVALNGGGVALNGGPPSSSGGPGGGGNGTVGGGGGGADPGTGGGVGGDGQTGAPGTGAASGGAGDENGGNGGDSAYGGGGGGGVGFGGGGGGDGSVGGGGAGYGAGGGGQGLSAGGGGGSSYVTASVVGTPTSSNTSTGNGQVTISYNPADKCPTTSTTMVEVTPSGNTAVVGNGASLTDFLTVTGRNGGPAPSNTAGGVDFYVCHLSTSTTLAPGVCPATGTPEDAHEILAPVGDKGDAESIFLPTGAGTWCFSTTYSGDSNYAGSSDNTTVVDANECALVSPASPTIVTTPGATSVTLGATPPTLTDTAVLSGGYMPTGTITFTLYNPGGILVATKTVTVSGNGSYTTPTGYTLPSTGTDTGTYQWDASYASGNANNTNTSENNAVAEQVKVVSPCGSLTAYFLTATSGTGNFTGIFCVNTAGTGTYTQYSPGPTVTQTTSGSGTIKISGTTTAIAASGTKLALLGEKTTASDTFTETAPAPMKTGTFTLTTLP